MKPVSFGYVRATSLEQSLYALREDPDAQLIAGGQTLVPLLNLRMARPSVLVDISQVSELMGISVVDDRLRIGAATRQLEVEQSNVVAENCPLMAKVMPWIGHRPTRTRGTVGGSLATGDPAAEIPLVASVLDAEIEYSTGDDIHNVSAKDFFLGPLQTALPEGTCITALLLPIWMTAHTCTGFKEVSIRQSDFAIASAAAQIQFDPGGRVARIALGVGAVGDYPQRLRSVEETLKGNILDLADVREALTSVEQKIEANGHIHASAEYSRRAAVRLLYQAIEEACQEFM